MFNDTLQEIAMLVRKFDYFLITATADADGDSIGAQLALKAIIQAQLKNNKDKVVEIVNESSCPLKYAFLPQSKSIITPADNKIKQYDVVFILDGGIERTGTVYPLAENSKIKVLVDHHKFGSQEKYNYYLHNPKASSTAEIVYHFLESKYWSAKLTPDIATWLYLGIIFDTGFFTYSLTSAKTHLIAGNLIKTGIDFPDIAYRGMKEKRLSAQKLLCKVLSDIKLNQDRKIIYSVITKEMMREAEASTEDQEGIIEQLFYIEKTEVAILFKEHKNKNYKLSFRSKGIIDVGKFCRDIAGEQGGGHALAAGCLLKGDLPVLIDSVITRLEAQLCQKN